MKDKSDADLPYPLKILVVDNLPPWYHGGVQKVIGETAKLLACTQNVHVEIRSGDLESTKSLTWNGISVKTYKTKGWLGYVSLEMLEQLKRDSKKFDILHVHGSGPFVPLVAALARKDTPLVYSAHYHPLASSLSRSPVKRVYDRLCNAYIFKTANKIICVSDTEKSSIQQRFRVPASLLVTIPNGVDVERIVRARPYDIDYKLVLSVGRLERHKLNQLTIAAMQYLPLDYRFYMVGTGSYQKKLQAVVQKLRLEKQIKILNSCSDDEVYRWLKTCSVVVNLSEIEAFGITVLEALAAGKGVIVNDKLGLAELAHRFTGAVFPVSRTQTEPLKLAELIEKVAATRAEGVDLHEFTWDRVTQHLLRVYRDIRQN
jgi:glycosyltransferase involved in cell wall biosynthesis